MTVCPDVPKNMLKCVKVFLSRLEERRLVRENEKRSARGVCCSRRKTTMPADHATIELLFGQQQWCALFSSAQLAVKLATFKVDYSERAAELVA